MMVNTIDKIHIVGEGIEINYPGSPDELYSYVLCEPKREIPDICELQDCGEIEDFKTISKCGHYTTTTIGATCNECIKAWNDSVGY